MGSSGKSKRTGSKSRGTRLHKRGRVAKFTARHVDQVRGLVVLGWGMSVLVVYGMGWRPRRHQVAAPEHAHIVF